MGRGARLLRVIVVVVTSAVLAGCSAWAIDDDEASPPPAPPSPVRPDSMDEETIDGAALAAVHFMEMIPYIQATGDVAEWESVSGDGCDFCHATGSGAVEAHERDGYVVGGAITAEPLSVGETVAGDAPGYSVYLEVRTDAATTYLDGTVEPIPASTDRIEVQLDWAGSGWQVRAVGRWR
ncbi:DUF6318 family protein [Ruania suaedae]|uniref:DUF6318 family protein n=1 Tax=Ruania suaedae TaxID=2897774 RepID=UPI001E50FA1B|nr:DUF6318 family protein [Ruania suaedae]UFU01814.1 DUF6318 family protein [Ruania suaedae]